MTDSTPADSRQIGVLVLHGIGSQVPDFADGLVEAVNRRLADRADRVVWQPVYWADVLEPEETDLFARMTRATSPDGTSVPLRWDDLRSFVVHNLGDAVAYHRDMQKGATYERLHQRVSDRIGALDEALADPTAPVVVIAHSLGAHILSNYVWDRQSEAKRGQRSERFRPLTTLTGIVSFGCNIRLFSLALPRAVPIDLPGPGVTKTSLLAAARWKNFLDRDDVLGWPLRPLYERDAASFTDAQRRTLERIEDYEIKVGGPLTSWNLLSHNGYWTDGDFTKPVAYYLSTVIDAVDAPE